MISPHSSIPMKVPFFSARREHSVFINCPFDKEFEPLMDSIIFSIVCCGFFPRSSLENGSVSISRIDRIKWTISNSKYSIHDLSKCRGEGD